MSRVSSCRIGMCSDARKVKPRSRVIAIERQQALLECANNRPAQSECTMAAKMLPRVFGDRPKGTSLDGGFRCRCRHRHRQRHNLNCTPDPFAQPQTRPQLEKVPPSTLVMVMRACESFSSSTFVQFDSSSMITTGYILVHDGKMK